MAHDVFVSHSTKDKLAADAVVAHLERAGIRCWVAPRDIMPGTSWATSILQAINQCKVMVVVFSSNANSSDHIRREVERAISRSVVVVPVRIEDVLPQGDLEYFLSATHWVDAITPPLERHFGELARKLRILFNPNDGTSPPAAPVKAPTEKQPEQANARERPQLLDCTGEAGVSAADVRRAQEAWAKYLGRQVEEAVEIANGLAMSFVLVPPGKFRMGSPEDEKDRDKDEVLHTVTLTEPFYLGKYEVTQAQYEALTGKQPSHFKTDRPSWLLAAARRALTGKEPSHDKGTDELPVEQVSWENARDYGIKLTKRRSDTHVYRLPTEAEWEYSCRGGRPSSQPFGIGNGQYLSSHEANFHGGYPYGGAEMGPVLNETCKVGSYAANALGLFDMHGNVSGWCADRYGPYPSEEVINPTGPTLGSFRVIRGGSWRDGAEGCRSALRLSWCSPDDRYRYLGFRLARSVPSGGK